MALDDSDARRTDRLTAEGRLAAQFAPSTFDSAFSAELPESTVAGALSSRWTGQRRKLLVACVMVCALSAFLLVRSLAGSPQIDASWRVDARGQVELAASGEPALLPHIGQTLVSIGSVDGSRRPVIDAMALQRSARWLVDDGDRAHQRALHAALLTALSQPHVTLRFADGSSAVAQPRPRGLAGLPPMFWLLSYFGLTLFLVSSLTLLTHPNVRNLLYGVMAWCQAGNLILIAIDSTVTLGSPVPVSAFDMPLRMAFDLVTAAAMLHAACLHPRPLPHAPRIAAAGWAVVALLLALAALGWLPGLWWWAQGGAAVLGLAAIGLLSWSYRIEPHPVAMMLRRFGVVMLGTWLLLTLAVAGVHQAGGAPQNVAAIGSTLWYVFLAAMLLLVPFLAPAQPLLREFLLLAAVSTIATALDLLFVTVFSLGPFASLTLSLFISLAVYSAARQWIVHQLLGSSMLTTERMFEQLYRIAREVEAHPDRSSALLSRLLRELFEPIEVLVVDRHPASSRVSGDGSGMLVPVPALTAELERAGGAVMIRFAHRGRRLFTAEDARLTDRIVEQLRRAVVFDKAVEQGRKEERLRLAQDLHDDIGARLLTLMYKAQSPEMEDYVRHTLQDLKTLTRGLAASNHRLSHAAAEWKADLTQRLTAADVELKCSFVFDTDVLLTVVQWSALTRVLRELVSNTIAHGRAQRLEIDFRLESDGLDLRVTDDGLGRDPRSWSHGLGLGGIRKRVKQLGGEVEWREVKPHGISCRVVIRQFSARS